MGKQPKESPTEQSDYLKAFSELFAKREEIVEWKVTRTLEEAKLLSINVEFQKAIDEIRERWKIEARIQEELIDPGAVLYAYSEHLTEADRAILEKDLKELAEKFDLDWTDEGEDYGLLVGALCYKLTPYNLTHYWDTIKFSVSKTRTPGVRILLNDRKNALDAFVQAIVISYLLRRLKEANIQIELPAPIREVIQEALTKAGRFGLTAEQASTAIKHLQDSYIAPDVMIRIDRNTTLEDIRRTWPQIEMRKVEWLHDPGKTKSSSKRKRIWRTYERDVFIWRRVNRAKMTYEAAYEEWLSSHRNEDAVEISAVIKAVKKIKEIPTELNIPD